MAREKTISITLAAPDADGLAASQTLGAAGNVTLDGALISGGSYTAGDAPHRIEITSAGNDSGITFTITGTNDDNVSTTEDITGGNATTVTSTKYWKTVTQIASSGATASTITVGTADEIRTHYQNIATRVPEYWAVTNAVIISGTINYTLTHTYDNIYDSDATITYIDDGTMASKTANATDALDYPVRASKLRVNSYSAGATIRWDIIQVS